jgi:hypothetical protein
MTEVTNKSSVINVGRSTPVLPGQQTAANSIPVVVASDQPTIPVTDVNRVKSEVALSLLGIPRSEVALGIFADVNTYDINPTEWSSKPEEHTTGWGIKHLPSEAGALVEAPQNKYSVLTSKRFFRYQPGRVSAATFGVKSTLSPTPSYNNGQYDLNPSIRKYGIFDKYDGYYWETRGNTDGDNFAVVRRTQSLISYNPVAFGTQIEDFAISGKAKNVYVEPPNEYPIAVNALRLNRFKIVESVVEGLTGSEATYYNTTLDADKRLKCKRDMDLAIEAYLLDLQYGANAHSIINSTTYQIAALANTSMEASIHVKLANAIFQTINPVDSTAAGLIYNTSNNAGTLSSWTIAAVGGTQPNSAQISTASAGQRTIKSAVFDIYERFFAYIASEYTLDSSNTIVSTASSYVSNSSTLSTDEIKYRCFRDLKYVIEGYGRDVEFGGNAGTVYNAKRYYFDTLNGLSPIQVYSQTPGGLTGEINRHKFLQALLTSDSNLTIPTPGGNKTVGSLKSKFPTVFSENDKNRLIDLSQIIINNFSSEYSDSMEFGSAGQFGDLVVLRDGLIMTHAAVYDPSLLKETRNVLVKPTVIAKTTGTASNNVNQITVANATGLAIGQSIGAAAIPAGSYVTAISGNTVSISANTTAALSTANVSFGDSTLETAEDHFVVGQYINFYGNNTAQSVRGLTANRLYRVEKIRGNKSNIISLSDATVKTSFTCDFSSTTTLNVTTSGNPDSVILNPGTRIVGPGLKEGTVITVGSGVSGTFTFSPAAEATKTGVKITKIVPISPDVEASSPDLMFINPNVPFVFPDDYQSNAVIKPDGMFPYMYSGTKRFPVTIGNTVGSIDSTIVGTNPSLLKKQIDTVNFTYNNWIKQNVDERYWSVYEYRIPRSRFSSDQLNGEKVLDNTGNLRTNRNALVYSDVATGPDGRVYPGQSVRENNALVDYDSQWEIDFTKVTMLKVEFSWYGAVGAMFLAYVPVNNAEARWVRVHHLRASNQLKISSLGNATLPITYMVYGGGSPSRLGIDDATTKGYESSTSNHIVKYGASYYIDGGDRGTVRLYSHSTLDPVDVYGSKFPISNTVISPANTSSTTLNIPYIDISGRYTNITDNRFFMKSKITTANKQDQNVEVVWVANSSGGVTNPTRLYLNKTLASNSNVNAFVNRPSVVFGLKAKENILNSEGFGVRNRVQVYPTKLGTSTANTVSNPKVKLQLLKTPLFQPEVTTSGVFTLTADYEITSDNIALTTSSTSYLAKDGTGVYGWFRAAIRPNNVITVFGYLYKEGGRYYFNLLETFSETVTLISSSPFLADNRFNAEGASLTGATEDAVTKERLSSVFVSTQAQVPIPKTGTEVGSFFLTNGTNDFDLLSYFDYNKDYLSFPLTNQVESVYLAASSPFQANTTGSTTDDRKVSDVNSSLTWEEQ